MKKNLSIILNFVLLAAVILLYFLYFTGKNPHLENKEALTGDSTINKPGNLTIVYVNEDSLLNNYKYFKELADNLENKRTKLEADYKSRAQGLQTEINNYKQNAGNLTISQARAVEEDLMRKQQNLMQYQETLQQNLMKEEADVNQKLFEKVTSFLNDYATEKGYTLVLNYKPGNALLYGQNAMDVTNEVVAGLNADYDASKQVPIKKGTDEKSDSLQEK